MFLATERLQLKPAEPWAADVLASLMSPEVSRWLASWPPQLDLASARRRLSKAQERRRSGEALSYLIFRVDEDEAIGWAEVTRSALQLSCGVLSFWIARQHHARGYGAEAAKAVVAAAFEKLNLTAIEAGAQPENAASIAILRSLGFKPTGMRDVFASTRGRTEACCFFELVRPTQPPSRPTAKTENNDGED